MNTYKLRITTPSHDVYDDEALQLSLRVTEGDIAIMAGHIPFVSAVAAGKCRVYLPSGEHRDGKCSGGLLSVTKENVRLLCSEFEWEK
ncbi:MAG: F0F1 ATP synthase subunit epsilon [Clostridia bacterium]|nr:F0F1 ATP synthase subunit epsilon [Clostridia bacterium]